MLLMLQSNDDNDNGVYSLICLLLCRFSALNKLELCWTIAVSFLYTINYPRHYFNITIIFKVNK